MNHMFVRRHNLIEVMRWLREYGGDRGVKWEAHGGKTLSIVFHDSALELAYMMEWDWLNPDTPPERK